MPSPAGEEKRPLAVLLVEDSEDDATLLVHALDRSGYDTIVTRVETADQMERELEDGHWEVILSDYSLPKFSAPEALALLKRLGMDLPFIVVSGTIGEKAAVEMMKAGAHDYVMKGDVGRLPEAIARELRDADSRRQRRKAEQALSWHAHELARSNAELEQFLYVASHDLKEPLRMVVSYTDLLAKNYKNKLGEDAERFIGFASEGAARIHQLVDALVAYSEVGRTAEGFGSSDTGAVLDRALVTLAPVIEAHGARVTHGPMPTALIDPGQILLVFQNLIDNAIKFRREDSPLVLLRAARQKSQWLFSLQDNGIGIEPRHVEKIFSIFQRLHGRDEYPGMGMGLAICRRIVENHGGRIWVESKRGEGSTFYFTLGAPPDTRPVS